MKSMRRFGISALLLSLALFALPAVRAGVWDHATKVNFHSAVQLPGIVLPPGEYRFQLLDSPSNRHVVQVFNAERSHVFGTFITIPAYREVAASRTVFIMEERPVGEPEAIKKWFYPGELIGDEFIYPHAEKSLNSAVIQPAPIEPVAATPESPAEVTPPAEETTATPDTTAHSETDVVPPDASQSMPPEKQSAEPAKHSEEPAKAKDELPKTASNLYLVLMLGGMLVTSGVAIRRFAKC